MPPDDTDPPVPVRAEPAEVELGWFAQAIGFHLRRAQEASFAAFRQRVGSIDIRAGHFAVIVLIGQNPGISQTALGRAVGRDKSSLTPVLETLESRGLVLRHRAPQDRRRYGLSLSPAGLQAWRELQDCAAAHEAELAACIHPDDREQFLRVLQRIADMQAMAERD